MKCFMFANLWLGRNSILWKNIRPLVALTIAILRVTPYEYVNNNFLVSEARDSALKCNGENFCYTWSDLVSKGNKELLNYL